VSRTRALTTLWSREVQANATKINNKIDSQFGT